MSFELSVTILNVGHGNSAVVRDGELTHIIDTGGAQVGLRLLDYLNAHGVTSIQTLILSHGDEDHIGSASTLLLSDVHVEQVFVNSDSTKRTKSHAWLMNALRDARRKKATRLIPALTLSQGPDLVTQAVNLEVLFPPPESVVSGPGGLCYNGTKQSTNSLSGVIRISGSG